MASVCPECDTPLVIDADAAEEGDVVACEECGTELEIVSVEPLQIAVVDSEGYDDEDVHRTEDEDDE